MTSDIAKSHQLLYDRPPRVGDLFEDNGVVLRVTYAVTRPDGTMDWASTGVYPTMPPVTVSVSLGGFAQAMLVGVMVAEAVVGAVLLVAFAVWGTS